MGCARVGRVRIRCFLEGVEVPVIAAQVIAAPNAPMRCAIQLPPLPEGTRLKPRTLVHLFFLDDDSIFQSQYNAQAAGILGDGRRDPTAYQDGIYRRVAALSVSERENLIGVVNCHSDTMTNNIHDMNRWKLLFGGEVVGFNWTKTPTNRSLVLQCLDWSNYWDYAYQWSNTDIFGPGLKALFSGGSTNLFTDFLSSKAEVIINILRTRSLTFPKLKGLAGGIVHLLEMIGGSYHYSQKIAGANIFFTLAELRLHITQMIVAVEDDPTATRLLATQGYGAMFNRMLGGQGGQTSIRQSINALQAVIFHEIYPQPCPKYIPGKGGSVSGTVRRRLEKDPRTRFIAEAARAAVDRLTTLRSQVNLTEDDSLVADGLEALRLVGEGDRALKANRKNVVDVLAQVNKTLYAIAWRVRRLNFPFPEAVGLLTRAARSVAQARTRALRWTLGDTRRAQSISKAIDIAVDRLKRLQRLEVNFTPKNEASPARLAQQILRPDVWFTAPPQCNVIFPEMYEELNYSRYFLKEPTRFLLKTNDEFFGEDELFDKFYFAPKTRSTQKDRATLVTTLRRDLLEHELYTGILPVFEKMGELNIFASRGGVVRSKLEKVGFAQRSVNFLYFKYRFGARRMAIKCHFHPYIAVGFPGLVLDKWADVDKLRRYNEVLERIGQPTRDSASVLGTNFLGNFTQVTHELSAQSATGHTSVVMSYPRQPEEGIEFLGASELSEVTVSSRFETDVRRTTDVVAINAPRAGGPGPQRGRILRVEDVTAQYRGGSRQQVANSNDPLPFGNITDGNALEPVLSTKPLLILNNRVNADNSQQTGVTGQRPARSKLKARVPVGYAVRAKTLPQDVRIELGIEVPQRSSWRAQKFDANELVFLRAYRVVEEVPRFRQEVVELPAEEFIRPGWYGDVWHPSQVGRAYDLFFGCAAITDPTTLSDPSGANRRAPNPAADDAATDASRAADKDDPLASQATQYLLQANASIEQAVAFLTAAYSHIKVNNYDVGNFIRAYTWRPIATMSDMFGSTDLQLSPDGGTVVQGVEGFHSRAFGQFNDLFSLVTPAIEEVTGVQRDTNAAQRGDTRKAKQDAVLAYTKALGTSGASIG